MKSDKAGSAGGSDATSKAPPPPKQSESEYLSQQAKIAREAISQTLHEMADSIKGMSDPRAWIENHPLASLGVGAVLGFAVASAVTPTRKQTVAERLKSLFPEKPPQPPVAYIQQPEEKKQSKLFGSIMEALKTAIAASVSSAIASRKDPENADAQAQSQAQAAAQ